MSQQADIDTLMPEAPQVYVNDILGPVITGWNIAIFMLGCLCVQYYNYVTGDLYKQDTRKTKAILHTVVALCTVQTISSWFLVSHYALDQKRDSVTLFAQTVMDCLDLTWVGVEGAIVQLFLAHRATVLMGRSKWRYLYWAAIIAGVLTGFAGSLLYLAASVMLRAGSDINTFNYAIGAWMWGSAWCDVIITVTLVVMLRKRMVHFSKQTDSILSSLIRLAIQSALPTALISLTGAILAFAFPVTSLYANVNGVFWGPMAGLYAMSLIATLNGRTKVREAANRSVFNTAIGGGQLNTMLEFGGDTQRNIHLNSILPPGSPMASSSMFTPPRKSGPLHPSGLRMEGSTSPVVQVGFPEERVDSRRASEGSEKDKVEFKV